MTRKDYVMTAEAIKDAADEAITPVMLEGIKTVATYLADGMKLDNPRFDRGRFLAACGFAS